MKRNNGTSNTGSHRLALLFSYFDPQWNVFASVIHGCDPRMGRLFRGTRRHGAPQKASIASYTHHQVFHTAAENYQSGPFCDFGPLNSLKSLSLPNVDRVFRLRDVGADIRKISVVRMMGRYVIDVEAGFSHEWRFFTKSLIIPQWLYSLFILINLYSALLSVSI